MLVGARQLLHGVDVQTAFVRERRHSHVGRADIVRHVGQLIHKMGQISESGQIQAEIDAHLQLQIRHRGGQVAVAHALAIAVDRPLHLHRSRADGRESVGDSDPAIVVRVDSHGNSQRGDHRARGLLHEIREASAVGFAEDDEIRAGFVRGFYGLERIFGILPVAVEKMFGVVQHLAPVRLQMANRIGDHREVFLQRDLKDLRDVQRPRLADDRHGRRPGVEQQLHLRVFADLRPPAARHPKRGDLRVFPFALGRFREKRHVLRIRAGPSAFDVVNPEVVELLRHANLIEHAERDPGPLRAIAQSGVVDCDSRSFHNDWGRPS